MSTITYTKSGINVSASVSIKKNGDATERCLTNCTGQVNGITTSDVDISGLTKGVVHPMDIVVTEGSCSNYGTDNLCCPATGGSVLGNLTPPQNTLQTYTVSGTDGNFFESGGNGGFSILGGNASFSGTPTGGIANVNVGTLPFTLCYNISSCSIPRSICISINPQVIGCTLSVTGISIVC